MTEIAAGALRLQPLWHAMFTDLTSGHRAVAEEAITARKLASPINHVTKGKPPILILASETDVSAPLPNAERMCKRMLEAGQDFEFENWPEEVSISENLCNPPS